MIKTAEAATMSGSTESISDVMSRLIIDQMYTGRVLSRPAPKKVIGILSKLSVKLSSPPPITAERMYGSVTRKKVCRPLAPGSAKASK